MRCAVDGCSPLCSLIDFSDTGSWCDASRSSRRERALQHLDRDGAIFDFAHGAILAASAHRRAPWPRRRRRFEPRPRSWPDTGPRRGRPRRTDRARSASTGAPAAACSETSPASRRSCAPRRSGPATNAPRVSSACASTACWVALAPRSIQSAAPLTTKASRPGVPPSWPRSKTNCAGRSSVGAQREHRLRQARARRCGVDGDDRLVAQRGRTIGPCAVVRRDQSRRFHRARRDDHAVEALAIDTPAGAARLSMRSTRCAEANRRARCRRASQSRRRQQAAQPEAGQEQVGRASARGSASCRTRRKTDALADSAGVFRAATQSGSIRSPRIAGGKRLAEVADGHAGSQLKAGCAASGARSAAARADRPSASADAPTRRARTPAAGGPGRRRRPTPAASTSRRGRRRNASDSAMPTRAIRRSVSR